MSKRTGLPIALCLVAVSACAPAAAPGAEVTPGEPASLNAAFDVPPALPGDTLRYDGIYQSPADSMEFGHGLIPTWSYLRFYPDSLVVTTSTHGEPHELSNFSIGNELLPYARVIVGGNRIAFSTGDFAPGHTAIVDYSGFVREDRLYLWTYSHFNGHRSNGVYAFVPMSTERLDTSRERRPR
ncbi:MAG TPA: hypothetical protein VHG08_26980 [Longimicrobium sp.]|nr:hypothetical protein [Longimicrobium sp.]